MAQPRDKAKCRGCGRGARLLSQARRYATFHAETGTYLGACCRKGHGAVEVRCRGCGTSVPKNASAVCALKTYNKESGDYLCTSCFNRPRKIKVTCRKCGKVQEVWPSRLTAPTRGGGRRTFEPAADGRLTNLCRVCCGAEVAPRLIRKLIAKRLNYDPRDADEQRAGLAAWLGAGIQKAGGRAAVVAAQSAARRDGISERGRIRSTVTRIVNGHPARELGLCPECGKLVQVSVADAQLAGARASRWGVGETPAPSLAERSGSSRFHRACWAKVEQRPEYRAWLVMLGSPSDHLFALRLRDNPPPIPRGPTRRPPTSEELQRHLAWLLQRHLLGRSWRRIAADGAASHITVRDGVRSLITRLPDAWQLVFGRSTLAGKLDAWLPIDQLKLLSATVRASNP